jgi:uncharacterized protein
VPQPSGGAPRCTPPTPPRSTRDLRPALALVLYLAAVFLGGALLAPWLHRAAQALAQPFPALAEIAAAPFPRYVNRSLLVVALVTLPLFVRGSGVRSWRDVGVPPGLVRIRTLGAAFALGFLSLAAVCAVALAAGGRELRPRSGGELAAQLLGVLATAFVVAVIEELLFRGAMFGALRRSLGWRAALVLSSFVYAVVHFMGRPPSPQTVDALSGLRVLPGMLAGMAEFHTLVPALPSLTLAGVVLALAFQRTGDLSASIGIHAGWIFWLRYYGYLTRDVEGADPWFWGTHRLVDGWLALVALVVVLVVVAAAGRRRRDVAEPA